MDGSFSFSFQTFLSFYLRYFSCKPHKCGSIIFIQSVHNCLLETYFKMSVIADIFELKFIIFLCASLISLFFSLFLRTHGFFFNFICSPLQLASFLFFFTILLVFTFKIIAYGLDLLISNMNQDCFPGNTGTLNKLIPFPLACSNVCAFAAMCFDSVCLQFCLMYCNCFTQ